MRLIDADELIKAMAPIISECKDLETMGNVIKSIEGQPTAFDKDRVLSTLHHYLDFYQGELDYSRAKILEKIINIIEEEGADG